MKPCKPRVNRSVATRVKDGSSWRSGKTTAQRLYGARWQKERKEFLFRNPECCYCQSQGRVTLASVVDHVIPHRGDERLFWNRDNWQPLCKSCHSSIKQKEEYHGA